MLSMIIQIMMIQIMTIIRIFEEGNLKKVEKENLSIKEIKKEKQ